MKIKVYEVVSSSYESADNYLHQESFMFRDKDKAREKFENLRDCIKSDIYGDEGSELEHYVDEGDYENRYEASREIGTEFEYQAIVELKEMVFDLKDCGLCETSIF